MDKLFLDSILNIVNKEKEKQGLTNYAPLYPMLRIENNKLYIGALITKGSDNIWDKDSNIKPKYWTLIDINTLNIIEFNKTEEKDFINGKIIPNPIEDNQKELSIYTVKKAIQYKQYLMNDIKNDELPIQKKLAKILNNELEVDGEKVNINEYLIANMEPEITKKVDELVDLLIQSKYSGITFYYDELINNIIKTYKNDNIIDKDKIKLCIEIMNNYYYGINGIENFFNI